MDKFVYKKIGEYTDLPSTISQIFNLEIDEVILALEKRKALGSVKIAIDIELPHVELTNIDIQGLIWVRSKDLNFLVMVIDDQHPSRSVIDVLHKLLSKEGLDILRSVHSQIELNKVIRGALKYGG